MHLAHAILWLLRPQTLHSHFSDGWDGKEQTREDRTRAGGADSTFSYHIAEIAMDIAQSNRVTWQSKHSAPPIPPTTFDSFLLSSPNSLPQSHNQRAFLPKKPRPLPLPPPTLLAQFEIERPHYPGQDDAHFHVRQVPTDTVPRAHAEGLEDVFAVGGEIDVGVRGGRGRGGGGQPAFRDESVGEGEVSGRAVGGVLVDADDGLWWCSVVIVSGMGRDEMGWDGMGWGGERGGKEGHLRFLESIDRKSLRLRVG